MRKIVSTLFHVVILQSSCDWRRRAEVGHLNDAPSDCDDSCRSEIDLGIYAVGGKGRFNQHCLVRSPEMKKPEMKKIAGTACFFAWGSILMIAILAMAFSSSTVAAKPD
jgi:hypothetical protein